MTVPLRQRTCQRDPALLDEADLQALHAQLDGRWQRSEDGRRISRGFGFDDFYQTMAFVNALAWVAHAQDHHPDLDVGYNRCEVHFSTHSAGGLSENDFICAARIDALTGARA